MKSPQITRRDFVKRTVVSGVGLAAGLRAATLGGTARAAGTYTATVAITKGPDRADNAFRAMSMFRNQIAAAIGNKRIIVKPNFVYYNTWNGLYLSCTHVDWIEGVLEFLKSIGKTHIMIAESSANASAMRGYTLNNYYSLLGKYSLQLSDLNQEGFSLVKIWGNGNRSVETTPSQTIRISKLYQNPNNFIISCAPMKTHNTAVATLSMKNISMSAPIVDVGNPWNQSNNRADKSNMHGPTGATPGDFQVLNDNVYRMAKVLGIHPHLAVTDGYLGLEGDGPLAGGTNGSGIASPQHLGVVSLDWVAADRVAWELMGPTDSRWTAAGYIHSNKPTYPACLSYAAQAGLGEWDLTKIQVIGQPIAGNIYNYKPHSNLATQISSTSYTTPRE